MADVRAAPRYSIVPGDPVEHKGEWLGLADRNLPFAVQGREARYSKYYEDNPLGPAKFFLARDAQSDAFVGMAAIFPTRLRVFGELVPAAVAGDFAVDDGHRGLGPSVALQRAVVSALGENGLRCAYGCPNEHSEPIVKRVGYGDLGRLSRFVKVLRSRVVVERYVRSRGLARLAAGLSRVGVDPFLSVLSRERLGGRRHGFRVEQPDRFDDRFADLWETIWREHAITSERNPELLNWRYEKNGQGGGLFTIFALVGNDERVAAYAVYRVRDGIRHLVDVAVLPSWAVVDALLSELILDSRRHGALAITLLHLGSANLLTRRLARFGFIRRTDESGLRVYVPGDTALDKDLLESRNWYFLTGDADV
jgi:GNAT superfamily N-acetyltransferase